MRILKLVSRIGDADIVEQIACSLYHQNLNLSSFRQSFSTDLQIFYVILVKSHSVAASTKASVNAANILHPYSWKTVS